MAKTGRLKRLELHTLWLARISEESASFVDTNGVPRSGASELVTLDILHATINIIGYVGGIVTFGFCTGLFPNSN